MQKMKTTLAATLVFACVMVPMARAAQQPLSVDDIQLLLIGGSTPAKMVAIIEQRGVNFQLTPDLEKKLREGGADTAVIEAIQKAQAKPSVVQAEAASTPTAENSSAAPRSSTATRAVPVVARTASAPPPPPSAGILSDPSPDQIQNIIREFAAKEKMFREARDNYTFHQSNKVETLDPDENISGTWQQDWDILYDDSGKRIERVTYAPPGELKGVLMTEQDMNAFRSIQPFVLTTDELPEYEVKYLGHVPVDQITTYVFSVRPKEIVKGHQYFQGVVWVDDRDLQIVKSKGKNVPELKDKHGENLFPTFTTYREQIDGKYWFPTFTSADDKLYFEGEGAVHIKEIIRYSDYKQFKSKVRILSAAPVDNTNPPSNPPQKPKGH